MTCSCASLDFGFDIAADREENRIMLPCCSKHRYCRVRLSSRHFEFDPRALHFGIGVIEFYMTLEDSVEQGKKQRKNKDKDEQVMRVVGEKESKRDDTIIVCLQIFRTCC